MLTLFLDLGGVVFTSSQETVSSVRWDVVNNLNYIYGHDLNIGRDVFPKFLNDYNSKAGTSFTTFEFLDHLFTTITYNEELVSFVKAHFSIIITSDNYRENIQFINKRYNISSWAKEQYYSYDFEIEKSDSNFFRKLLKKVNVPIDSIVFIDDSLAKIRSAESCGIYSIQHLDNATTIEKLQEYLNA